MRVPLFTVLAAALIVPILLPQAARDPAGDWPMYAHDLKGTKFSTLKQINVQNVTQLKQAWSYRFNRAGKPTISDESASELYQKVTPIVVNSIMYTPAGDRVMALEPETGKKI